MIRVVVEVNTQIETVSIHAKGAAREGMRNLVRHIVGEIQDELANPYPPASRRG